MNFLVGFQLNSMLKLSDLKLMPQIHNKCQSMELIKVLISGWDNCIDEQGLSEYYVIISRGGGQPNDNP